jgi:hypothetical protein
VQQQLDYQPVEEPPRRRTTAVGLLAAIGLAGLVCIGLYFLAAFYVTYLL